MRHSTLTRWLRTCRLIGQRAFGRPHSATKMALETTNRQLKGWCLRSARRASSSKTKPNSVISTEKALNASPAPPPLACLPPQMKRSWQLDLVFWPSSWASYSFLRNGLWCIHVPSVTTRGPLLLRPRRSRQGGGSTFALLHGQLHSADGYNCACRGSCVSFRYAKVTKVWPSRLPCCMLQRRFAPTHCEPLADACMWPSNYGCAHEFPRSCD